MINPTNFKLAIGMPITWTHVPTSFFLTMLQMERPDYILLVETNGALDDLRNNLVRKALDAGCSHLLMMDTDQTYAKDTVPRLIAHNKPIVGACVHRRYPPFDPILYKGKLNTYQSMVPKKDFEWGNLVQVSATGTGCLLFDLRVFEALEYPWFKFTANPDSKIGGIIGEDIWFCHKCQEAGIPIYVDTSFKTGHLSCLEVTKDTYDLYNVMKEAKTKTVKSKKTKNN